MIGQKFISNGTKEEIIVLEKDTNKDGYFLVQFIDTGEIKSVQRSHIKNGVFKSSLYDNKKQLIGKIFANNQGLEAIVEKYNGVDNIIIRFLSDNTLKTVTKQNLLKGVFRKDKIVSKADYFLSENKDKQFISKDGYSYSIKDKVGYDDILIVFDDEKEMKVGLNSVISNNIYKYTNKEKYEGMMVENKYGEQAKIVEYNGIYDVKIMFLDDFIEKRFSLNSIKNKTFKKHVEKSMIDVIRESYVGNTIKTKDGKFEYTILEAYDSNVVKVKFSDGTIRSYPSRDIIGNNVKYIYDIKNAIGKKFLNYKGEEATIIEYRNAKDVDVIFNDGEMCKNTTMAQIRKGLFVKDCENQRSIENMKRKYIGKIFSSSNGETATVLDYKNNNEIYVEFSDGYKCYITAKHLNRDFAHPLKSSKNIENMKKKYEGLFFTTNKGYKCRVLNYISSNNVLIEFLEDKVTKTTLLRSIKTGRVEHPNDERTVENYSKKLLGKTFTSNNGDDAIVIEYNNSKDIKIQFEDGTTSKVALCKLQIGRFSHPNKSRMNKEAMANTILGKEVMNSYGMKAVCIKYLSTKEVYMQFEDGVVIRTCKSNISKGSFSHPYHNTNTKKNSFVVYRMLDKNNNILYIGRSTQFSIRMYQHFSRHMFEENKNWYKKVDRIQYIELDDFLSMSDTETYLINKYKPIGNLKFEKLIQDSFKVDESKIKWNNYDMDNFAIYQQNIKGIDLKKLQ